MTSSERIIVVSSFPAFDPQNVDRRHFMDLMRVLIDRIPDQ